MCQAADPGNSTGIRVRNPETSTSICPNRGHSAHMAYFPQQNLMLLGNRITHDTPLDDPGYPELTLSNMTHLENLPEPFAHF